LAWALGDEGSMSASEKTVRRVRVRPRGCGLRLPPAERGAGDGGVVVFEDGEDAVKGGRPRIRAGVLGAESALASAELAARTRSKMAARAFGGVEGRWRAAV
jgi:hypothetical protein